ASVTVKVYTGGSVNILNLIQTRSAIPDGSGDYSVDALALAEGTYTAQAEQSDAAGNTGFSDANTFVVDTTAPVVALATPADGSSTNATTPALALTLHDALPISASVTVKVYTGGSVNILNLIQTRSAIPDGSGDYSVDALAL